MVYSYSFSKKAIKDASNAVKWYKEHSLLAAENLITELEYVLLKIRTSPLRFRLVSLNFRAFNFSTLPYRLFYAVEENEVIILRIRHGSQKPLKRFR